MKRYLNLLLVITAFGLITSPLWIHYISAMPMNNFSGAIYSSTEDGLIVNKNRYASKMDVYLNGGPQGMNPGGLPNETYYFQVTDPSGATLLSSDPARCRQLTVMNGVVNGAAGPLDCRHPNGDYNPANGSTSVQLYPFDDTPNNGGEYKVWLIRKTSQTSVVGDPMTSAILQFNNKDVKTDNFKVGEQPTPTPTPTPCDPMDPECSPPPTVTLSGHKFYDANANGIDNMEAPVANIQIQIFLNGSMTPIIRTTDGNGDWSLTGVVVGSTYSVNEVVPCIDDNMDMVCDADKYWVQTAPVPDSMGFQGYSGTANVNVTGLNFGDICFGPASGGKTLGFWSNKNGEAVIKGNDNYAGDFAFLNALNLKNYNGTDFDIVGTGKTGYTNFRTWLLNGNAVNMAYMLSVQLSATSLDVRHGYFSDGQIVDATSLGLGYVSIGSVRNAANTELNALGGSTTFTGNPLRDDEEILKNFLDGVNNNRLPFGSATPCSVFYP